MKVIIFVSSQSYSRSNPSTITCQVKVPDDIKPAHRLALARKVAKEHYPEDQCVGAFPASLWNATRQAAVKRNSPLFVAEVQEVI